MEFFLDVTTIFTLILGLFSFGAGFYLHSLTKDKLNGQIKKYTEFLCDFTCTVGVALFAVFGFAGLISQIFFSDLHVFFQAVAIIFFSIMAFGSFYLLLKVHKMFPKEIEAVQVANPVALILEEMDKRFLHQFGKRPFHNSDEYSFRMLTEALADELENGTYNHAHALRDQIGAIAQKVVDANKPKRRTRKKPAAKPAEAPVSTDATES